MRTASFAIALPAHEARLAPVASARVDAVDPDRHAIPPGPETTLGARPMRVADSKLRTTTDYHVHTARCGHAGGAMRAYVEAAIARGLSEIAFTDHVPLYFLPGEDPDPGDRHDARASCPGYVEEVRALSTEFAGRIDVLLGLEADYAEGHEAALAAILASHDWDVVLGSVHWVKGDWIDAPRSGARHEREGSAALWSEYYRLAREGGGGRASSTSSPTSTSRRSSATGCRRKPRTPRPRAIRAAQAAGVAVEVSSAGLRKTVAEEYPSPPLLTRLVAAGVPIVFSSDAHAPAEVAWGRERIEAAATAAGATEHLSFRRRERRRHPI